MNFSFQINKNIMEVHMMSFARHIYFFISKRESIGFPFYFLNSIWIPKMSKQIRNKEQIRDVNFSSQINQQQDFNNREFINCVFSELSDLNFIDCNFRNCNLSNLNTANSRLQNVSFFDCT